VPCDLRRAARGRARHPPPPALDPRRAGLAGAGPARARVDRRAHGRASAAPTGRRSSAKAEAARKARW
jgi:hypothetical protein